MRGIRVFIYGSLLPGQSNHHVISAYVQSSVPGAIAGRMVDVGPYPAALLDISAKESGSRIEGLWIAVDRKGLEILDALEDYYGREEINDYNRVWTRDDTDAGLAGWVYAWDTDRGFPLVPSSYWPDYCAAKEPR